MTVPAADKAFGNRRAQADPPVHSGRGARYCAHSFHGSPRKRCPATGRDTGRKWNCRDSGCPCVLRRIVIGFTFIPRLAMPPLMCLTQSESLNGISPMVKSTPRLDIRRRLAVRAQGIGRKSAKRICFWSFARGKTPCLDHIHLRLVGGAGIRARD
jgi:hypothetical protein